MIDPDGLLVGKTGLTLPELDRFDQIMTETIVGAMARRARIEKRPLQVRCTPCEGSGDECEECVGTGVALIAWDELFSVRRGK